MHGFSSVSALLVNAEVDSMGGVVESGDGVGNKTSAGYVVIEKVQAELRQEYDVREERRRELEFLEKGGNPLDFKVGNAASVSVHSTSLTDHNTDQFVTSEAKGSFAITASPHGDSVESSGRPGAPLSCEPNSADNLMLFDGENEFSEGDRNSLHPHRNNIAPSEHSLRLDGSQNPKELWDSATFGLPRKAYKRRYRSRPSRNGARSGSNDVFLAHGGHGSLPLRHSPRDVKGPISHAENQDLDISLKCNSKPTSPKGGTHVHKTSVSDGQQDTELDGASAVESSKDLMKGGSPNVNTSKFLLDGQLGHQSLSGADKAPNEMASDGLVIFEAREEAISTGIECQPTLSAVEVENQYNTCPVNETQYRSAACGTKGLHSESACTHPSQIIDGNNDSEMYANAEDIDSNGNNRNQISVLDGSPSIEGDELVKKNKETKADDLCTSVNEECSQSHQENGLVLKADEELNGSVSAMQYEATDQVVIEGMQAGVSSGSELERQPNVSMGDNSECKNKNLCNVKHKVSLEPSNSELIEGAALARVSTVTPEGQTSSGPGMVLTSKAAEDSILEEAQIIEAKRKRILELSTATLPLEKCRKSQWAYLLEEMAWLANDFAQERLWKLTAAAQICHRVAFTSQLKKQESLCTKIKKVAHSLAKAVMDFWHSVEDTSKELERQSPEKDVALGIHSYALRFLKYNNSDVLRSEYEEPMTPDRISDMGFLDMSGKEHLIEENLFYRVPPGALQSYRRSIESHAIQCEKTGSSMQEEVETSACDAVADFESQANAYEEDVGETIKYDIAAAFEDRKFSRFVPTNRKHLTNAYISRSYEAGPDSSLMHCMENKAVMQQSALAGKRPSSSLNVSFPTKRVRTASRRVFSPYSAGTSGFQLPNKTDASSGDTNSFQDDQSTLHGGSLVPNSLEVESLDELEKQLPVDCADVSTRPKKKKKAKHLNNAFEQRWQMDSNFCNEQREHLRKRSEGYQLESNGSNGLFGQHVMKKPKVMQQLLDNSFDNVTPTGGSVPSPVASQMSNMPNPNKFIKMLGGRDRNRKTRALKMPAGHMGSGSPWSLLEDQALIVLVHDMGPNWELVCDALNSTLQFKCIFRKPNECKEHHKILMDRTSGDGADSNEDSGSSQPYPSTLPGIPKGSARQLFQRLQGPVEEDTLKSHFEKIIMIGQKQNYRKTQNDNQDSIKLPDCSHTVALSQVCPNNLNGGTTLTPLDLCDTTTSSSDMISLGYQGAHSSGLVIPNQGTMAQTLPASGAVCAVQGSSNLVVGNNFSSPVPLSASARDGRYGVPRSTSLSIDEQQRVQQYNQMMSGRNIQQTTMSTPGNLSGTDRGVRMLPSGNGTGVVGGINRTMPMMRPGFQGIATSSMVNSGSMGSPGMVSMPSAVNMHSGVGSGQGNSTLRPRDSLHMMRPGISLDSQRQIMVPDVQMQVSPGNSQGLSPFGGLASSFPNQTATPPVSSYPLQHQQSHPMSPQQSQVLSSHHPHVQGANHAPSPQQAFAIHLAKERHLQHQFLQEQQQRQFAASNTLMSHGKPQSQLPISSPMRNSAQIQNQTSSPVSLAPSTSASSLNSMLQNQQKHQLLSPGMVRNAQTSVSGLTNQMGKQRSQQQQQQFSQANRQHPQQRQQSQSQQQTKHVKGVGRGNLMHQNIQIDPSLSNGLLKNLGNKSAEKGEATHLMQGQGINSGSAVNAGQSARKSTPLQSSNHSLAEQKIYSSQAPSSSKHKHQMTTHSDSTHVPAVSPGPELSSGHQAASNHQQAQPHQQSQVPANQNSVNQNQPALHRVMQQNHQLNSNLQNKPQTRDSEFDQHPASISFEIGARTTLPQPCNNATNVAQVFHTSTPRWTASEHSFDPSNLATNLGSMGSTSENSIEPAAQTFEGPGQRQSPANLLSAQQLQLQQSQLQPTSSPVVPNSQSRVPQSGNVNSCGRPDSRLE